MKNGFLVAVDGIDGSGKTTMAALINDHLYSRYGDRVMQIQMPGATALGQEIRKLVKSVKAGMQIDPIAERLLFCADNVQMLNEIVIPALNRGQIIVADRWSFITDCAYGVPNGLDVSLLDRIQNLAPEVHPHLYIVMKCSFETAKQRMALRQSQSTFGIAQRCRIEEKGESYLRAVCSQYSEPFSDTMNRARAKANKVVVVDAEEGIQEVKQVVLEAVDRCMMVE